MKDIPNYEGLYAITNDGQVWNYKRQKWMKCWGGKGNYQTIELVKNKVSKSYLVHRLVAMTYIPNPDNLPQVNHKDETRDHNWVSNLEWCTAEYNSNYGTRNERFVASRKLNRSLRAQTS